MHTTLITGSDGFVGSHLINQGPLGHVRFRFAHRSRPDPTAQQAHGQADLVEIGDISATTDWSASLSGIDCVVHMAGVSLLPGGSKAEQKERFREANLFPTINLARQAAAAGVKHFIFISSVKAAADFTTEVPIAEGDRSMPVTEPYGAVKKETEDALFQLSDRGDMKVTALRPPLMYGTGVKQNFHRLMKLAASPAPLPFKGATQLRSLLAVNNMVTALCTAIMNPACFESVFFIRDDRDASVADIFTNLRRASGRQPRLMYVPPSALKALAGLVGKRQMVDPLFHPLRVDDSQFRARTGWKPEFDQAEILKKTMLDFLRSAD